MDALIALLKQAARRNPGAVIAILEMMVALLKQNPELLIELIERFAPDETKKRGK
jgi:hypothetical protein